MPTISRMICATRSRIPTNASPSASFSDFASNLDGQVTLVHPAGRAGGLAEPSSANRDAGVHMLAELLTRFPDGRRFPN